MSERSHYVCRRQYVRFCVIQGDLDPYVVVEGSEAGVEWKKSSPSFPLSKPFSIQNGTQFRLQKEGGNGGKEGGRKG